MENGRDMVTRLRDFVSEAGWLQEGRRVLLAVSGGVDSVAMADLFHRAGYSFGLAHCNFQLRAAASDKDADLVQAIASNYDVPFFLTSFDTETLARERKTSIQLIARELRYEWLEEIRATHGFDWVGTAHHLNDSIETALFNWTKGTGLRGLLGVPKENGYVIRPLLFASREELEAYVEKQALVYRTDASNLEDKYSRNKIRHHVWPVLKKINPGVEETFRGNLERLGEINVIYEWGLQKLRENWTEENEHGFRIPIAPLQSFPAAKTLLFEWLRGYGFSKGQSQQIFASLDHEPGAVFYSATHRTLLDRDWLVVAPLPLDETAGSFSINQTDQVLELQEGRIEIRMKPGRPDEFSTDANQACLDADQLIFPLTLRHWQTGDRFAPLGMGGQHQKLQDLFSNQKLSRFEKEQVWLLVNGNGQIIWVVGLRMAESVKITGKTKNHLRLSYQKL